ncbi:MAG: hypothetical protein LBR00_01740 [Clostridiales Family XIII bacterium]|nr:hypothetical protein [Clostridiales Family XIII bacterium]
MTEILNNDKGPFQVLFGDDASADPNVVMPIVIAVVAVLLIVALRVTLRSKGRSEMSEEELAKDRKIFDGRMEMQARLAGEEYDPSKARAQEEFEMKIARGELDRYGNPVKPATAKK